MTARLPRFLDRVIDATAPTVGGLNRGAIEERLRDASLTLRIADREREAELRAGFLLAANLAARLYPRIALAAHDELREEAAQVIGRINPGADVCDPSASAAAGPSVAFGTTPDADICVNASGWNVYLDSAPDSHEAAAAPASLAAGALGVAQAFRMLMADHLAVRARRGPEPAAVNLATLGDPCHGLRADREIDVGRFRLVGAGAIGQAAMHTLAAAQVVGSAVIVDPERIELSNLQRYVLSEDADVGRAKVDLVAERLTVSGLDITTVPTRWSAELVDEQVPTLVGLDSAEARIAVQASLPGPLYNAWTQPADLGWSRHERFGDDPCLACLYWPDRQRPSRHEQIAAAFDQHPLRVLAYLVHRMVPVGLPLPEGAIPQVPGLDMPPDAAQWLTVPLLDDIAAAAGVEPSALSAWTGRPLADVYQEGICGGALLYLDVGQMPQEVVVPLAHQSALAGIMLATQLMVASVPELRAMRPRAVEGRLDVLSALPQVLPRPRAREPRCLCSDSVFRLVYRSKAWTPAAGDPQA